MAFVDSHMNRGGAARFPSRSQTTSPCRAPTSPFSSRTRFLEVLHPKNWSLASSARGRCCTTSLTIPPDLEQLSRRARVQEGICELILFVTGVIMTARSLRGVAYTVVQGALRPTAVKRPFSVKKPSKRGRQEQRMPATTAAARTAHVTTPPGNDRAHPTTYTEGRKGPFGRRAQ